MVATGSAAAIALADVARKQDSCQTTTIVQSLILWWIGVAFCDNCSES
jgi:hypothetical protein